MPRKPRIEYPGAVYHVTSRGQRRERMFLDATDYRRFLETFGEACERTGWVAHAYVLMPNHYHLLLETPEANLCAGMQWFQGTYSTRFRLRHGLVGHVLQGRFKAPVIEPDSGTYFQTLSSYIHLNPVRARGLLKPPKRLETYAWSSYPFYLQSMRRRPGWLRIGRVLGNLGLRDDSRGRRAYRDHVEDLVEEVRAGRKGKRMLEQEWKGLRRGWCFGGEGFREEMVEKVAEVLRGKRRSSYAGGEVRSHDEREAKQLLAAALDALGLSEKDLRALKKTDVRKQVTAWWVRRQTTVRNRWVAERLHMGHEGNVSSAVRRVEDGETPELRRLKKRLAKTRRSED